jgi:antitoxin MazE
VRLDKTRFSRSWWYIVSTICYRGEYMLKHLTRHGNSAALILDKAILELLRIKMDTPLELATDGKNLIVSPIHNAKRQKNF